MPEVGTSAPRIEIQNQHGEILKVDYDRPTVIYFYPEDDTPGCSTEAEQFQLELDTYREAGVEVYGISTDFVESHQEFAEKYDLDFNLLSDPDGEVAERFDVSVDQGRAARMTYVIVNGDIHKIYENVNPDGHARSVLMDLLDEGIVTLGD